MSDVEDEEAGSDMEGLVDLEDIGNVMKKVKEKKIAEAKGTNEPKEMITPSLRKSLTKQVKLIWQIRLIHFTNIGSI